MTLPKRPFRLLAAAVLALCAAGVLWALFGALRSGLALWQALRAESPSLQLVFALAAAAALGASGWIAWRLLRRPRRPAPAAPTRAAVEQRVSELAQAKLDTAALQQELEELDRRARSDELYVAVFGEISAGKSALIRALLPQAEAESDVLGGTTRAVTHYRGTAPNGAALVLADVPGTHEAAATDGIESTRRAQRDSNSPSPAGGRGHGVRVAPNDFLEPTPRAQREAIPPSPAGGKGHGAMDGIESSPRAQREAVSPSPAGGRGHGVRVAPTLPSPVAPPLTPAAREQTARDEALRAHVVLYVCAGDLTRDQDAELRWLHGFGKPLVLVLNKADQFRAGERELLERTLRTRYAAATDAQAVVSAGGSETFERHLPDGRREHVTRERKAEIEPVRALLARYAAFGAQKLEPAREAAVLSAVAVQADALHADLRENQADAIVAKYTRRAVVGALAAVMPGTDLVIQGVLATALIRELGKHYDVSLRDIDIDAFLGQVKLTLRTSASLVLAIAGNALKAFPGLGTLGGGVLHAIAYGLIFDSLGRAVAATLRDQHRLDSTVAASALAKLLAEAGVERLRRIAGYALDRRAED